MAKSGYWIVNLSAYSFATKDEALAFQDRLTDAFCEMPESKGIGSSSVVEFVPDKDDKAAIRRIIEGHEAGLRKLTDR